MSTRIDLKIEWKHLYQPPAKEPVIVDVPPLDYLMLDGHGDPNTAQSFKGAVSALFSLSYAIKFAVKKREGVDYAVMPLEGQWWVEDMAKFSISDKSDWDWTVMILQPEYVSPQLVDEMRQEVARKKGQPLVPQVRFERYDEGTCVQLMHIGPFSEEAANIARIHEIARQQGYENAGKHHEIYLSNLERTAPEKLKTVLRQPIRKAG